jgi:hypothetical protein
MNLKFRSKAVGSKPFGKLDKNYLESLTPLSFKLHMLGVQSCQLSKQVAHQDCPALYSIFFAKPFKPEDEAKLCSHPPSIALSSCKAAILLRKAHSKTYQRLDSSLEGFCQNKVDFTIGETQ